MPKASTSRRRSTAPLPSCSCAQHGERSSGEPRRSASRWARLAASFRLVGAVDRGPRVAMQAGMTTNNLKDKIDSAADKAKDLAEKAGQKIKQGADKASEKAHGAADKIKDAGNNVGKKVGG